MNKGQGLSHLGIPKVTIPEQLLQHLQDPAIKQALAHHLAMQLPPPPLQGAPGAAPMQDMRVARYSRIFGTPGVN